MDEIWYRDYLEHYVLKNAVKIELAATGAELV